MARSRQLLYLTLSGLVCLILTLTVTTCGSGSGAPTAPGSFGGTSNAVTVEGPGTCQYTAIVPSFDVGPNGLEGEILVTAVTGKEDLLTPCKWFAKATGDGSWSGGSGPAWLSVDGWFLGSSPFFHEAVNGVVTIKTGIPATVKFSVQNEADDDVLWTVSTPIGCATYQPSDFTMTPQTASFDYAGAAGQTLTVEVASPKTREGSILIYREKPAIFSGSMTQVPLFEISVTQTGSVCSWHLHAINCDGPGDCPTADLDWSEMPASDWISADGGMSEGSGTASFAVAAGDVPAGNPAPRNGAIVLLDESVDKQVGITYIDQLGPECSYSYAISQSEFAFAGGTAQLTVTPSHATCGWYAVALAASVSWISVDSTNAPCPGGVCYGTQTVQVVVQAGDVGVPPIPGLEGRSGTVIIYQEVGGTFELLFTVPLTQFRQDL